MERGITTWYYDEIYNPYYENKHKVGITIVEHEGSRKTVTVSGEKGAVNNAIEEIKDLDKFEYNLRYGPLSRYVENTKAHFRDAINALIDLSND